MLPYSPLHFLLLLLLLAPAQSGCRLLTFPVVAGDPCAALHGGVRGVEAEALLQAAVRPRRQELRRRAVVRRQRAARRTAAAAVTAAVTAAAAAAALLPSTATLRCSRHPPIHGFAVF